MAIKTSATKKKYHSEYVDQPFLLLFFGGMACGLVNVSKTFFGCYFRLQVVVLL